MEGGTDFDLQVLEAPAAPVGGEASGSGSSSSGGGEKTQGDSSGTNVSGSAASESTVSRMEDATRGETSETKESEKVRTIILVSEIPQSSPCELLVHTPVNIQDKSFQLIRDIYNSIPQTESGLKMI